jgi:hypothetical protein
MESVEHGWPGTTAHVVGRTAVEDALEQVYRERLVAFVRVASAIVGDRDRALDVVQEGSRGPSRMHPQTNGVP